MVHAHDGLREVVGGVNALAFEIQTHLRFLALCSLGVVALHPHVSDKMRCVHSLIDGVKRQRCDWLYT